MTTKEVAWLSIAGLFCAMVIFMAGHARGRVSVFDEARKPRVVLSVVLQRNGWFKATRHDGVIDDMMFRTVKEAAETAVKYLPDELKNYKAPD